MEAIRVHAVVEEEGEIHLTGLPLSAGQQVELIVIVEREDEVQTTGVAETQPEYDAWPRLTAEQFLNGYSDNDAIYDNYDQLREQLG